MVSVAFKTPLKARLGIYIYKTSLLPGPDDYIGFAPNGPPTFYKKIAPLITSSLDMCAVFQTLLRVQRSKIFFVCGAINSL